jgi:hypothetical protein
MLSLLGWIQRASCSLRGHDDQLLEFERGRMFLRCVSCGHATRGWQVGKAVTPQWERAPEAGPHTSSRPARERHAA